MNELSSYERRVLIERLEGLVWDFEAECEYRTGAASASKLVKDILRVLADDAGVEI